MNFVGTGRRLAQGDVGDAAPSNQMQGNDRQGDGDERQQPDLNPWEPWARLIAG